MDSNGQFLLYDALLAFLVLFVVLGGMFFVLESFDDVPVQSNEALDDLVLLSSMSIHDSSLLQALVWGDDDARDVVMDVLSDRSFVLKDVTLNRVLLENGSGGGNVVSARKIVGGHEFELILFF